MEYADTVWLVDSKTGELRSPYQERDGHERVVAAKPFTVRLMTVVVTEDLDGMFRGKNDLMVISRTAMGESPKVERVHFYEEEVPEGRPIRNVLADSMYVADDYDGTSKLWLEVDLVEIDRDAGDRKAAVQDFHSLAATAGAVFPAALPYTFAASATLGVVEKLVAALERDTHVVKVPFALYPGRPRIGRAVFQEGVYVAFARPVEPGGYALSENGLLKKDGLASPVSYVAYEIVRQKFVSPNYVMSQKVATLLTQLHQGNSSVARATISFLNDTISKFSSYRKLERYLDLRARQAAGEALSDEEKALMGEIAAIPELSRFLPT